MLGGRLGGFSTRLSVGKPRGGWEGGGGFLSRGGFTLICEVRSGYLFKFIGIFNGVQRWGVAGFT